MHLLVFVTRLWPYRGHCAVCIHVYVSPPTYHRPDGTFYSGSLLGLSVLVHRARHDDKEWLVHQRRRFYGPGA